MNNNNVKPNQSVRQICLLISLCLCFFSTSTLATSPNPPLTPIPFDAKYDVSLNGSNQLEGSRSLVKTGDNEFTLTYKAKHFLFKIKETSKFQWLNNTLTPIYYRSERSHLFGSSHKDLTFDWAKNIGRFYYKDKEGTFDLEPEAVDPLSTMFIISTKIQQGITDMVIKETEDNDIDDRHYTVDGTEMLNTPIGQIETIKATLHDKESATIWLAVDYNYLAVRVRHESKGGDVYELNLTDYNGPKIDRFVPIQARDRSSASAPKTLTP